MISNIGMIAFLYVEFKVKIIIIIMCKWFPGNRIQERFPVILKTLFKLVVGHIYVNSTKTTKT